MGERDRQAKSLLPHSSSERVVTNKVQGVRKETALTVTGGTGGGCSVTSASWRSLRASCVAGVQHHALCVRPLLLSQQPGVAA